MSQHIVELNGLSFNCRIDGDDDGAPWLVFSNSLVTDLGMWDEQAAALKRDFRILRYDHRGHGRSSVPTEPVTFQQLADDVAGLLDHFAIDRCTFVGISMGVPTGLQLYSAHPERVERLVFCDGQAKTAPTGAKGWDERIDFARQNGMEAFADMMAERWFGPDFRSLEQAQKVRAMIAATPIEGFVGCARALQGYDYEHVLATVSVPTLLMVGERDGAMPAAMQKLADAIDDARLAEIPDAGHISNMDNPVEFNRVLTEFLTEKQ